MPKNIMLREEVDSAVAAAGEAQLLRVYEQQPLTGAFRITGAEWYGPTNLRVFVSADWVDYLGDRRERGDVGDRMPDRIDFLSWPLRRVTDYNYMRHGAYYVRADVNSPLHWLYHRAADIGQRSWRWIFSRIVWTLVVWGLASIERGTRPTWGDILKPQRESRFARRVRAAVRRRLVETGLDIFGGTLLKGLIYGTVVGLLLFYVFWPLVF